ncbi:hypothetical protein FM106_02110 [Brachybacterium faecium]|nr:hypothetical protein FM106_02110 [Brachybacterium faecium]
MAIESLEATDCTQLKKSNRKEYTIIPNSKGIKIITSQ